MDADYDVRVPNDYSAFKELMRSRREAIRRLRKEREMQEQWGSDEEDEEDEDLDLDEERRRKLSGCTHHCCLGYSTSDTKLH